MVLLVRNVDRWYADLWQRRIELRRRQKKMVPEKPMGQLSTQEIAYWVAQFDSDDLTDVPVHNKPNSDPPQQTYDNPFPPGYGTDLSEDES